MEKTQSGTMATIVLAQNLSKALYDYWNAMRNGRAMPWRREIDPGQLRTWLPQVALLEKYGTQQSVFRLAGTSICAAFGRELRDHTLASLWLGRDREPIEAGIARALKEEQAVLLRFNAVAIERRPLEGEITLLPLRDDAGEPTRVLASFAVGTDALRLLVKPFVRLELITATAILPGRDHVVCGEPATATPRPALALVHDSARRQPPTAPLNPTAARPWGRLIREAWLSEDQ